MSQDRVATIFARGNGVDAAIAIDGVQIVTLTRAATDRSCDDDTGCWMAPAPRRPLGPAWRRSEVFGGDRRSVRRDREFSDREVFRREVAGWRIARSAARAGSLTSYSSSIWRCEWCATPIARR